MEVKLPLATAKIEDLEKLKALIENTIEAKKEEEQRQKGEEMTKTYRDCLIANVDFFISHKLTIDSGRMFHHCIKHFMECNTKKEWLKENFLLIMDNLTVELCNNFRPRRKSLLSEHDTYMLLCEFKTELSRVEL